MLSLLIAFLLTPPSLFLWTHLPELAFLQFPWRLTALLGVILALTTSKALHRLKFPLPSSLPLPCLILAAALALPCWRLFRQPCDYEDTVPARVALFHSNLGTEATDEYTPTGVDGDTVKPGDPPFWLLPASAPADTPAPVNATPGQAPTHLTLQANAPEILVLDRRQYPSWQVRLNGQAVAPIRRRDGLIAIALPAGSDTIDLKPIRTPDQTIGLTLSALACLLTAGITRKSFVQPW